MGIVTSRFEPIDGETPIDPSELKIRAIRCRADLLPYEAENVRKAVVKYLAARPSQRLAPFNYDWLLQLHREMFGNVWGWAGEPRNLELSIGVSPEQVIPHLGGLVLDIEALSTADDLILENAVQIHLRAVRIHPFKNGNGRWARLLANIWLKQNGRAVIEWPEAEVGQSASSIRADYLRAIRLAVDCDLEPLIELHRRFWPDTS